MRHNISCGDESKKTSVALKFCKVKLVLEVGQLASHGNVISNLIYHKHEGEPQSQSHSDGEARRTAAP